MILLDDKKIEGDIGEYVHTDEDRVTVPSSRRNDPSAPASHLPPLKSHRGGGEASQRSMYSNYHRDMGSSSVEDINHSLKQTSNNMKIPGHIL